MEILCKVGDKVYPDHSNYNTHWRDGQIVDMRHYGFHDLAMETKKVACVISTPDDFWSLRGSTNWKSTIQKVYDLKKYISAVNGQGKYKWSTGYIEEDQSLRRNYRRRDYFVDFKYLLDQGWITQSDYNSIYNKEKVHNPIYLDRDFTSYLFHEDAKSRLIPGIKNDSISSGSFTVGAGGHATTLADAEANHIAATLTGDLTVNHLDEETAISSDILFTVASNGYLFKITADSGAEHNGGAYGNGARVNMATSDSLVFQNGGDVDAEVSKLALEVSGSVNRGIDVNSAGDGGLFTINRLLIAGDADTAEGIRIGSNTKNIIVKNSIIYGLSGGTGIAVVGLGSGESASIFNNTLIGCDNNFLQGGASLGGTLLLKNNLCQAGVTADYSEGGGGYGTTAKNVSEDATSPDAAYRSKDVHTNDVFQGYATDMRLDSGGDSTNLAILDDGENLYGSGVTEDIAGTARDDGTPFWIGASHLAAAAGANPNQSQILILGFIFQHPILSTIMMLLTKLIKRRQELMK